MEEELSLEDQGVAARQFLNGVLDGMDLSGEVAVSERDEAVLDVSITGDDLGLLIGTKGSTLLALQELTRTVVQRRASGRTGRIFVDVDGYREKRRQALERFVQGAAAEVRDSGTEQILEPMSPPDRKVVHDTVNTIAGVSTRSQGEEPERYVVLIPGES